MAKAAAIPAAVCLVKKFPISVSRELDVTGTAQSRDNNQRSRDDGPVLLEEICDHFSFRSLKTLPRVKLRCPDIR